MSHCFFNQDRVARVVIDGVADSENYYKGSLLPTV